MATVATKQSKRPTNPTTLATASMVVLQSTKPTPAVAAVKTDASAAKPKRRKKPRAERIQKQNAHFEVVLEAARAATQILRARGLSCAIFGSLASKLYGCSRVPKDVDLLVSQNVDEEPPAYRDDIFVPQPQLTAEELKDLILRANSQHFYLKMPRDPAAEYRILWYRQKYQGPECKVDILVPGTMHLPFLNPQRINWVQELPLVPFSLLLFHKLKGWDDHCKAEEAHYRRRQQQDAADVAKLLALRHWMKSLKGSKLLDDEELFDEEFKVLTKERVKLYCEAFNDRAKEWKELGFETGCI